MVISLPARPNDRFVDGIWRVGEDISPGLYYNNSDGCYWERLSGFDGTSADRITNEITPGPSYVRILASDTGFKSSRCGFWVKAE